MDSLTANVEEMMNRLSLARAVFHQTHSLSESANASGLSAAWLAAEIERLDTLEATDNEKDVASARDRQIIAQTQLLTLEIGGNLLNRLQNDTMEPMERASIYRTALKSLEVSRGYGERANTAGSTISKVLDRLAQVSSDTGASFTLSIAPPQDPTTIEPDELE